MLLDAKQRSHDGAARSKPGGGYGPCIFPRAIVDQYRGIQSADATQPGESSIAALVTGSTDVTLRRVRLRAGAGHVGDDVPRLLERRRRRGPPHGLTGAPARPPRLSGAALESAARLVPIPNAGGRYSTKILPDPNALYRAREAVGLLLARGWTA